MATISVVQESDLEAVFLLTKEADAYHQQHLPQYFIASDYSDWHKNFYHSLLQSPESVILKACEQDRIRCKE